MADDLSLIEKIKTDKDESCLKELISRHSGIYLQIVNQTISEKANVNKNDILDEKDYAIYQAALEFDPHKEIKFSTYLGNSIRWKCLNIYNQSKRYEYCDISSQSESLVDKDRIKDFCDDEILEIIFDLAEKNEDPRVRKIVQMRYKDGAKYKLTPWKQIAKVLNLSIQGCINIHKRFIKETRKHFKYD
jgi:RNA polymerase sigma factor (sigma-70 family)